MDTVAQHETEIADLKGNLKSTGDAITKFSGTQTDIIKRPLISEKHIFVKLILQWLSRTKDQLKDTSS